MELDLMSRLKHSWNAFKNNRDPTRFDDIGPGYSVRPDRPRFTRGNEKTLTNAIFNRIAIDVSSIDISHCKIDDNGRYLEDVKSSLNDCLKIEANIDQSGRAFMQDVVMSMLDEGVVAIVPIDTNLNPNNKMIYDIESMRTGRITEWYPMHVKVRVYNQISGKQEEVLVAKKDVSIIENPFYSVINESNSTLQRLKKKLNILDGMDDRLRTGKLDMIVQLPYALRSELKREEAEKRRRSLETQMENSVYGIGYIDSTERIIQLNRPLDNNLLKQIEYLTSELYSQLGITQSILDGTADEQTLLNYYSRTIEPIISAIADEMNRKFLGNISRMDNQTISFFRDPFKLVPINNVADIADKFTRNEIMTSNEIRQSIGMKPSSDPKADELRNSNLNHPENLTHINEEEVQENFLPNS